MLSAQRKLAKQLITTCNKQNLSQPEVAALCGFGAKISRRSAGTSLRACAGRIKRLDTLSQAEDPLNRLETLSASLANHFKIAEAAHRQKLAGEALRIALDSNQIQLQVVLDQVLSGDFEPEHLAELCHFCKVKSAQSDELYFEQQESGEPEAVWSIHFHKARAYAALGEFCESSEPQLEEVLYEALQSQPNPDELISSFVERLCTTAVLNPSQDGNM